MARPRLAATSEHPIRRTAVWHPDEPDHAVYREQVAAVIRPRGPLPRRVYWFRRLLVLGVACALVVGIARLLDWSRDGSESGAEQATAVAAEPSATAAPERKKRKASPTAEPVKEDDEDKEREELAKPEWPCEDGDVLVTPVIEDAHAGSDVKIVLELTTVEAEACFWEVSPESVFVNIESEENGTLWSSQHCPGAVPTEDVVPRRERPAKVTMWWNGKESDEGCPVWTEYVLSGSYTAVAAALGSVTPVATGFYLGGAVAPTVTKTPTPTKTPKRERDDASDSPSPTPSPTPSATPSSKPSDTPRGD